MTTSSVGAGMHQRSSSLRGYFCCEVLVGDTWRAKCAVDDHVLRATGSSVDGLADDAVWERIRDTRYLSVGVGCTIGACRVGCVSMLGAHEIVCVTRRRSIYLFLSITGEGQSLAIGVAWLGFVIGD